MNIKSLLIGSAAAMVAVSGARAADAVVIAEPEPVEYVRVCDAYGSGFFYIPGTETCLAISGYVWYQVGAGSYDNPNDTFGYFDGSSSNQGWIKSTRARVNFDARSDTEWGTLRGFIRMQADFGTPSDGPVAVDQAYISLGGLIMGYTESFWANSGNGGASNWGSHSWGGMYYGYQQRHLIGYRYNGPNGFFGALSLEDDRYSGEGYVPDVVAKVGVTQGWGTVWAKVAYDESFDGFGAQLGAQINVPNMAGTSIRVIGYYADGAHLFNVGAPGCATCGTGGAEWSLLASVNYQVNSTFGIQAGVQYFNDLYVSGSNVSTGIDAWGLEVGFVWFPFEKFEIRTEVHYDDVGAVSPNFNPNGTVSGILRFTRSF